MAGDWIKWCVGLASKPEIVRAALAAGIDRHEAAGRFMVFCEWADANIPQEEISSTGPTVIKLSPCDGDNLALFASIIGNQKLVEALHAEGWLKFVHGSLELPNFWRHNGETSKTRARNHKNQKRKRKKDGTFGNQQRLPIPSTNGDSVTNMSPPDGDKTVTRDRDRDRVSVVAAGAAKNVSPPNGDGTQLFNLLVSCHMPKPSARKAVETVDHGLIVEACGYFQQNASAFKEPIAALKSILADPAKWDFEQDASGKWQRPGQTVVGETPEQRIARIQKERADDAEMIKAAIQSRERKSDE